MTWNQPVLSYGTSQLSVDKHVFIKNIVVLSLSTIALRNLVY